MSILERGVGLREVPTLVSPSALRPGQRRARDQADQRMRDRRSATRRPRRRARSPRRATGPRGSRVRAPAGPSGSPAARLGPRRLRAGAGSSRAARAARAPNTKHSVRELEASRLAPCRPGARALADREQPGQARAAVQVGGDPAHHVVGRRGDRDELTLGIDPGSAQRGDDVGKQRRSPPRACPSATAAAPLRSIWRWIARATSSRGASSSTNRSPSGVEQLGALASDRLGDEEAVRAVGGGNRGRVKLHHLQVGQRRRPRCRPAAGRRRSRRSGWSSAPRERPRRRWPGSWPR